MSTTAESVVFVLDFSASMRGDGSEDEEGGQVDKSKLLRRALDDAVKRLSRKARFSIILFGGTVKSGMPYVTGDEDLKIAEITKPGAVACLTDAGFTGGPGGVLGREWPPIVERFLRQTPQRFNVCETDVRLHGCVLDIDDETGRARSIERVSEVLK